MIPKVYPLQRHFGRVAADSLHDAREKGEARPESADRVEWADTRNLPTSRPEHAARLMAATAKAAPELKRLAGVSTAGRKLEKPVLHYTLSWPKEEQPDRQEMTRAADETLKALGLETHEALIVAHRDKAHPHVHVIANRVDPDTGKAANLAKDRLTLSRWAERWERDRGPIRCLERVKNNARRARFPASMNMISPGPVFPHLTTRAGAIEALGWSTRDAEWIALVCLHSGVFLRAQFCHIYDCSPQTAMRFRRRLTAARLALEHPLPDSRTNQKLCHIHGKSLYRMLGDIDARHRRRWFSEGVLWRQLLSLDAVVESPGLPWLPTEAEKVGYFTGLGIDAGILPKRVYVGPRSITTRHFALKLPIAGDRQRATFVYADPGLDTIHQLRRWCREHAPLWAALRADGLEVHVHAVSRTHAADDHIGGFLHRHREAGTSALPLTAEETETLKILEAALDADDRPVLARWGGLIAAADVADPLRDRADALAAGKTADIDRIRTHVATRVADDVYAA